LPTRLNREIKAFCKDFRPVRDTLKEIGATRLGEKEQVDYFFRLPSAPEGESRRLKLRIDDGAPRLIYYYDRYGPGSRTVEFSIAEVTDPGIRELLEAALGVKRVVRKRREVWKEDNATFNLDTVEGIGNVFETEVEVRMDDDAEGQIARYRRLFGPHLGEDITGSNEDLVAAQSGAASPSASPRPARSARRAPPPP